ncbi:transcriptional regulator, IclR family [Rhizobiales bacterium GAS113]|nr:transcriptional regulator, IclR family [Rhizobiales bacterium GAS113]
MNTQAVNSTLSETAAPLPNPQGVGLLVKAFQILDLFTDQRSAWTQADLARETGLARSTMSRLVRFLAARGYLLERHGRYTLGFSAVDLGRRAQSQFNLVDLAYDLIAELAQTTAETVILTGYDEARAHVVCLAQIASRYGGLRVFESVGTAYPLHSGATAKAVLAFLPERQIENVLGGDLTPVNPAIETNVAKLREDIARIRERHFAVTFEETYPGVTGVGVPVLTPRGQPLGSIAVAGPANRMDEAAIARCAKALLEVGRKVTARIAGTAAGEPA